MSWTRVGIFPTWLQIRPEKSALKDYLIKSAQYLIKKMFTERHEYILMIARGTCGLRQKLRGNGVRLRLWKWELKNLANELKIPISVCLFPPGTSKWNKVEHRLFSFISKNWQGEPLRDYETVVKLISNPTTQKGQNVPCRLDLRKYPTGRKVTNAEMKSLNLHRSDFHGDWNYTISSQET